MESNLKLTPKQNAVIWCLQNGWAIVTDSSMKGAVIAGDIKKDFSINNAVFWNLVDKGLIRQQLDYPHNYILTKSGKEIKTKPVTL